MVPRLLPILALIALVSSSWTLAVTGASPPEFVIIANGLVDEMTSDADGVWGTTSSGIVEVTDNGLVIVVPGRTRGPLARDADGAFYSMNAKDGHYGLRKLTPASDEPVPSQSLPSLYPAYGFGADGNLITSVIGSTANGSKVYAKIASDRGHSTFSGPAFWAFEPVVGPDGALYGIARENNGSSVIRVDVTTGESSLVVDLGPSPGIYSGLALGDDGAIYLTYYLFSDRGDVVRVDPATGVRTILASLPFIPTGIVFFDESVYVSFWAPSNSGVAPGVGKLNVGTTGFQGFHPTFQMPPAPDLAITNAWVERQPLSVGEMEADNDVNEQRRVLVEISNLGLGDVTVPFRLSALSMGRGNILQTPLGTLSTTVTDERGSTVFVPGLAAGETVVVEVLWNMTTRAGDHRMQLWVDLDDRVPETLERANNNAYVDQTVRVADVPLA